MSLTELPKNTLYVVLKLRNYHPDPDNFHWGLYLHKDEYGGSKYHIKQEGSPTNWIADHGKTAGLFKSLFLVGIFCIAEIPRNEMERVDTILRGDDTKLREIGQLNCGLWVRRAMERLAQAGLLKCSDLRALEREVKDWGNANQSSALEAAQPRPVGRSALCQLR